MTSCLSGTKQRKEPVMLANTLKSHAAHFVLIGALLLGTHAQADLTLTVPAMNAGFTLSTFATGFASQGPPGPTHSGPLGVAYRTDHAVLVADNIDNGHLYVLPSHADGQVAGASVSYGGGVLPFGLAQVHNGGVYDYYMTDQQHNNLRRITGSGGLTPFVVSINNPTALAVFPGLSPAPPGPHTGHLFVTSAADHTIFEVDPAGNGGAGSVTPFVSGLAGGPDGITFSPNGSTLYVAQHSVNTIRAISVANPANFEDIAGAAGV